MVLAAGCGVGSTHAAPRGYFRWLLVITVCLYLLRFLWVLFSLRAARFGRNENPASRFPDTWRSVAIETLGGVRGAVSYAAILTLPSTLPDGTQFPYRDVGVVITASVVVLTFLIAMQFLPRLLGRAEIPAAIQEAGARAVAAAAGFRAIERATNSLIAEGASEDVVRRIGKRVSTPYRQRLQALSEDQGDQIDHDANYEMMLSLMEAAFRAERDVIVGLSAAQTIDQETCRRLIQEVDIAEIAQMSRMPRT
jgi:NhaP-type Na+/H+ or K+/H+ antiporter